jgi:hypothetical protein
MFMQRGNPIQGGFWAICVLLAMAFASLPMQAELGGNATSIENDRAYLQGSRRVIATESYTVHEIQAASGTVVREYISPAGAVFAVTWQGPWFPDMRQLLGSLFETYRVAAQSQSAVHMARRPVTIKQPGLVVQVGGHVRAFSGRAYVPDMVPSGVRVEDLQ